MNAGDTGFMLTCAALVFLWPGLWHFSMEVSKKKKCS